MNPYKILNLPKDFSEDELKETYKSLVLKNHPDKGGISEDFLKIQSSYRLLSSDTYKRFYDATGIFTTPDDKEIPSSNLEPYLLSVFKESISLVQNPVYQSVLQYMQARLDLSYNKTQVTLEKLKESTLSLKEMEKRLVCNHGENFLGEVLSQEIKHGDIRISLYNKYLNFISLCKKHLSETYSYNVSTVSSSGFDMPSGGLSLSGRHIV